MNQERITMKTLWRARGARSSWLLNLDFDEFFVSKYSLRSADQLIENILVRAKRSYPKLCTIIFDRRSLGDGVRIDSKQYHHWQNEEIFGRKSGITNWGPKTVIHPDYVLKSGAHHAVCIPSKLVESDLYTTSIYHGNNLKVDQLHVGQMLSDDLLKIGTLEFVLDNNVLVSQWDYKERMKKAVFIHGLVSTMDHMLSGSVGMEIERDKNGFPVLSSANNTDWSKVQHHYEEIISKYLMPGFSFYFNKKK